MSAAWTWHFILVAGALLSACGSRLPNDGSDADAQLDEALAARAMLLSDTQAPIFFPNSEPDAPALGFGSQDARLIVRDDPSENGRTPVRVLGRLHLEAYVPDGSLELHVQQGMSITGTPVVLQAGDRVRLIEPRNTSGVHRIAAWIPVEGRLLGPYTSRLEAQLLSSKRPATSPAKQAGLAYVLPAGFALPIYTGYHGDLLSLVPPLEAPLAVSVLAVEQHGFIVRVGSGPFLQGFTNAPLKLLGTAGRLPKQAAAPKRPNHGVPWRIAREAGPLLRVAAGTQLRFRGRVVATLRGVGWARALGALDAREVEVLAAVDEQVTVRGVATREALTPVRESDFGLSAPTGPSSARELGSARLPALP